MRSIEIAVDGGGGDGRRGRNGRQEGRAAVAGQGDGVSPSYLFDFNERDIPHTTIQKFIKRSGNQNDEKKVSTFCVPKKVRLEGSPFTTSQRSSTAYFAGTQNISCQERIPQGLRRNW